MLRVAEDLSEPPEVRIPIGSGIAGASRPAARPSASPTPTRIRASIRTWTRDRLPHASILCLPLLDRRGEVFAVAQLLNRRDGQPFDAEDQQRLAGLLASIARIFEGLQVGRRRVSEERTA